MTSTPTVSVIIATYNRSNVLPYSVASALRQTLAEIEVIVVGDGCTDDSSTIINRIEDERVRWINLATNSGHQSAANNEGLRQARGEFIAYLGHDDLWLPHHLSCLVAGFAAKANAAKADIIGGMVAMVAPGGSKISAVNAQVSAVTREVTAVPMPPEYKPGAWYPPTGVVHRRELTNSIGGWRDYRELTIDPEVDLWQRAYKAGSRFVVVPRLTAIKLPAAQRQDVYKQRPHHEQAEWFERIKNESDLEATLLMQMLVAAQAAQHKATAEPPYRDALAVFLRDTLRRFQRRLTGLTPTRAGAAGERIKRMRRFKGLE